MLQLKKIARVLYPITIPINTPVKDNSRCPNCGCQSHKFETCGSNQYFDMVFDCGTRIECECNSPSDTVDTDRTVSSTYVGGCDTNLWLKA